MLYPRLEKIWMNIDYPFFLNSDSGELYFNQLKDIKVQGIEKVKSGDVVALIGDFDPESISSLLHLLSLGVILVPLTMDTKEQHEYFFEQSFCQYIFQKNKLKVCITKQQKNHPLLDQLRKKQNPGLIFFTTGTTGRPKAIIHDFLPFIDRYKTPRPPLKALSFLLFDHIGGLNTLFHMLFNLGQVVAIKERRVESVLDMMNKYSIELLPTTPTFLRIISLYKDIQKRIPDSLKIISYGTERMDQNTLSSLCKKFPRIDFRQTYGMSELGILRIKSKSRDSLFMKVGGEGIETKVVDNILYIKAANKMLGYLNSKSPFDSKNWYCTKDIVEEDKEGFLKIVGRDSDIINIGGLKFMPYEIERECLKIENVKYVKAIGKSNPITGQHLELIIEPENFSNQVSFKKMVLNNLKDRLPRHMVPSKIKIDSLKISHRFKKL